MSRQKEDRLKQEQLTEDNVPIKRKRSKWTVVQWFLIPLLLLLALGGGLTVGYVVLGKKELSDVLHWSTWKHIYDLVFAP
ncbi:DNA-directed RNA polymerase subunit beta [Paenibacillus sophorae]|uniref:DNA-directed RNA polymerase subunit beta n=1 Tax=Paenibacillus sophorae TaxID=1333845 RepID=A0A1H8I9K6_9BACL|nr:DNA-directed RNA polymerase subunit beta [Paenibacillus sophorae]QWU15892.1 DNA-directed RNA polymerase subunit beta [Paenibacillus sophorae]SEN65074.1 DNA-directed RNA polymerase subunit beta [Paenibacillus sophorae]